MHIFIPTIHDDIHAALVDVALRRMGHKTTRWIAPSLPELSSISITFDGPHYVGLTDVNGTHDLALKSVDVLWNRRARETRICADMNPNDKVVSEDGCDRLIRSFLTAISDQAFAVNPPDKARFAEDKVRQLIEAVRAGFEVPRTLFGGKPHEIRSFVSSCTGGAIVKPLRAFSWVKPNGDCSLSITARVTADNLPSDEMLRLSPAIFQAEIQKSVELRINVFGESVVAISLAPQNDPSLVDGRHVPFRDIGSQMFDLPDAVALACVTITRNLGLVFAAIDVILTPSGRFVFLELNQMGQFVYLEHANPSLRLLQHFCDLLVSCDRSFAGSVRNTDISYGSCIEDAMLLLESEVVVGEEKKASRYVLVED